MQSRWRADRSQNDLNRSDAASFTRSIPQFLGELKISVSCPIEDWSVELGSKDAGGCQNYDPFLDPYYNTAPNV